MQAIILGQGDLWLKAPHLETFKALNKLNDSDAESLAVEEQPNMSQRKEAVPPTRYGPAYCSASDDRDAVSAAVNVHFVNHARRIEASYAEEEVIEFSLPRHFKHRTHGYFYRRYALAI